MSNDVQRTIIRLRKKSRSLLSTLYYNRILLELIKKNKYIPMPPPPILNS
jgi:hypothetical protein